MTTEYKIIRKSIKNWLESWVNIQAWDLDVPQNVPRVIDTQRYPANSVVEMPMERFSGAIAQGRTTFTAKFPYAIVYRFSGRASKEQLPLHDVENLIVFLAQQAIQGYRGISDRLEKIEVKSSDYPVKIGRTEGDDSDWLIAGLLDLYCTWNNDGVYPDCIDFGVLQPEVCRAAQPEINSVEVALNRSYVPSVEPEDPTTFVEDYKLDILLPEE